MTDETATAEKQYLEEIKSALHEALEQIDARVRRYAEDIQDQKTYLWEHRADMDHVEKISTRQSVEQALFTGEAALDKKRRIKKLIGSPYFGRFDFRQEGEARPLPVYVGIHAFYDENRKENLVYDWRAPISTMFYDFEVGEARYEAPAGEVRGEIELKRQFRIRNGRMEFMFDTAVNVLDDMLQEELSRTSDERMRNIVATIQRDQNAIIRNEHSHVVIIQGVAGSGKTSIALHRVAFLLYRFKDTISSKDILIISPNRVFGDYISNVLPELGEEQIVETEMDSLARDLLDHQYKFQTFAEQNALLMEGKDEALGRRIREKSSLEFLKALDKYIAQLDQIRFTPEDVWIGRRLVPAWSFEETFAEYRTRPIAERLKRLADMTEKKIGLHYNYDLLPEERATLKAAIKKMYRGATLRATYKEFFTWWGRPELFKPAKQAKLEYSDVFPLIHLKIRLDGVGSDYRKVKHLLVDEMQDYTPVQYAVINRVFPCKKTILGDANQSVNPFCSSSAEQIAEVFSGAYLARLCKSYRSSYEITRFAQRILPNAELEAVARHGDEPEVLEYRSRTEETKRVGQFIAEFAQSGYRTMAIVCKTDKQAERLHKGLGEQAESVQLLTTGSSVFSRGVVLCSAPMAKGLEFDWVVVPEAGEKTYSTVFDRNLLYVACTRAMHRLTLTCTGMPTRLIEDSRPAAVSQP